MKRSRRQEIDAIFSAALSIPAGARDAWLDQQCAGDEELKRDVVALLQAHARVDDVFGGRVNDVRDRIWASLVQGEQDAGEDLAGYRIDAWHIDRQIARGGLATVYLAHRDDGTFDQQVAFKVLRRGLDTDDLIRRFRAERQILSGLDHPGIARILDGGAIDDGRPYLVLEYVNGVTITDYCVDNNVGVRSRVRLLIEVAAAVHHAHQHLVVHRDIKPSNILVTEEGRTRLLDFGIAKLLDPEAQLVESPVTQAGMSLLTPSYASPEQLAKTAVTTASDIYQLGLVMYELFTGERPFADSQNRCQSDPQAPSRRLRGQADYRQVRGDLDAIVLKALHANPKQRYASADELTVDLKRYLSGLPVSARPDTLRYRLAKLTRRRPWLVPVAGLTVLATAAYVTTLTLYNERLASEQQLSAATERFLVELFRSPDPLAPAVTERGRTITVVEALQIGQQRVRDELGDQPELQVSLLRAISEVYQSLEVYQDAISLREEAVALERELYGEQSLQVTESLGAIGRLYTASGDNERAAPVIAEYYELAYHVYPDEEPALGEADIAMGTQSFVAGDLVVADAQLSRGIARLLADQSRYAQQIIDASATLSETRMRLDSPEGAQEALITSERIAAQEYGPTSLQAAMVRADLAATYTLFDEYEKAEATFREAITIMEDALGEDHSDTLDTLTNLGVMYTRQLRLAEAEQIQREVLARRIRKYGPVNELVAVAYQNLASALTHQGRYDESIPLHQKAYETYRQVLKDDNFMIALPLLSIANAELQRKQPAASEIAAREAVSRFEASMPDTFFLGVAQCLLGLALEARGNLAESAALLEIARPLIAGSTAPDTYYRLCGVATK